VKEMGCDYSKLLSPATERWSCYQWKKESSVEKAEEVRSGEKI
jgi:hypothetical protein